MGINFLPNYYVDITDEFENKIEAIMKHKSQNPQNMLMQLKYGIVFVQLNVMENRNLC